MNRKYAFMKNLQTKKDRFGGLFLRTFCILYYVYSHKSLDNAFCGCYNVNCIIMRILALIAVY